jgi:hypothetical protein
VSAPRTPQKNYFTIIIFIRFISSKIDPDLPTDRFVIKGRKHALQN